MLTSEVGVGGCVVEGVGGGRWKRGMRWGGEGVGKRWVGGGWGRRVITLQTTDLEGRVRPNVRETLDCTLSSCAYECVCMHVCVCVCVLTSKHVLTVLILLSSSSSLWAFSWFPQYSS